MNKNYFLFTCFIFLIHALQSANYQMSYQPQYPSHQPQYNPTGYRPRHKKPVKPTPAPTTATSSGANIGDKIVGYVALTLGVSAAVALVLIKKKYGSVAIFKKAAALNGGGGYTQEIKNIQKPLNEEEINKLQQQLTPTEKQILNKAISESKNNDIADTQEQDHPERNNNNIDRQNVNFTDPSYKAKYQLSANQNNQYVQGLPSQGQNMYNQVVIGTPVGQNDGNQYINNQIIKQQQDKLNQATAPIIGQNNQTSSQELQQLQSQVQQKQMEIAKDQTSVKNIQTKKIVGLKSSEENLSSINTSSNAISTSNDQNKLNTYTNKLNSFKIYS